MESLDLEKCGGYNAHFLHELLDDYECPVCKMALREPVLTLCGHRLCFSCLEEMKKRNNGVLICPLDKTILNSEKIFPDKFTERVILQLKVKCDNFLKSCQWTGELKTINNHLTSCEYQEVKCLNEQCSTTLLRKELSDHMEKDCIYRLVTCRYCKQKITFCDNQIHEEKCECVPLCCVNQCGTEILRKEISSHITDSCANTIIPCQYLNIGCNFKENDQEEYKISSNEDMFTKLSALEDKIIFLEKEGKDKEEYRKSSNEEISTKLNALKEKVNSLAKEVETIQDYYKNSYNEEMTKILKEHEIKLDSYGLNVETGQEEFKKSINEAMTKKMNTLENKINSLERKVEMSRDQYKTMNNDKITTKIKELENKVDTVKNEIETSQENYKISNNEVMAKKQKDLEIKVKDYEEYKNSSNNDITTKLNALEDKINYLAKEMETSQEYYKNSNNEVITEKLKDIEIKVNSCASDVEHLNKRMPEPRRLKDKVWLKEPTDSSKLIEPVLEEEKCLDFHEILKQMNARCKPK